MRHLNGFDTHTWIYCDPNRQPIQWYYYHLKNSSIILFSSILHSWTHESSWVMKILCNMKIMMSELDWNIVYWGHQWQSYIYSPCIVFLATTVARKVVQQPVPIGRRAAWLLCVLTINSVIVIVSHYCSFELLNFEFQRKKMWMFQFQFFYKFSLTKEMAENHANSNIGYEHCN